MSGKQQSMSTSDGSSQPQQSGAGKGKSSKKDNKISRSIKAGLRFPVGRCHRIMKQGSSLRVSGTAAVYMTAILEYLSAEILELAGNASKDMKVQRITPRHLLLAVKGDEELDTLIKNTVIAGGGVIPHVHTSLLAPIKPAKH